MTEPYTPETGAIREAYRMWCADMDVRFDADRCFAEFDRWFIREIEAAEYSGYLRAKEEAIDCTQLGTCRTRGL